MSVYNSYLVSLFVGIAVIPLSTEIVPVAKAGSSLTEQIRQYNTDPGSDVCAGRSSQSNKSRCAMLIDHPNDNLVDVNVGNLSFKVPYLYLTPRPKLSSIAGKNYWDSMGFSFWWPNIAPSVENTLTEGTAIYSRPNINDSTHNEVLIQVKSVKSISEEVLSEYTTPSQFTSNLINKQDSIGFLATQEFGLIKYTPINQSHPYIIYASPTDSAWDVHMSCDAKSMLKNQFCSVKFYWKKEKIALSLLFMSDYKNEWEKIVVSTLKLLKDWRVAH